MLHLLLLGIRKVKMISMYWYLILSLHLLSLVIRWQKTAELKKKIAEIESLITEKQET